MKSVKRPFPGSARRLVPPLAPANSNGRGPDDFAEGLVSLRRSLHQRALFLTQDRAEAEDLMQDTLERALVSREQFLAGSNLRAWLFSIMRNRFIDGCRHATSTRLRQQAHQPSGTGAMSTDPDTSAFAQNVARPDWADEPVCGETHQGPLDLLSTEDVDAAIATLGPAQREIFELAYRQRVSHRVIAARLRVPVATISTRLFRGRARLRSFLEGLYRQRHGMSSDSIRENSESRPFSVGEVGQGPGDLFRLEW